MNIMKKFLKKIIPSFLLGFYHWLLANTGAALYGHPSRSMIIIGVTGTKGKSTVVSLIAKVLETSGQKVGLTSTINFSDGKKEWRNDTKQTMPGRFTLQKMLAQMQKNNCRYAVIETSSEGIAQHRHLGIDYDVAVLTNISPEHIESHGNYENYRKAKSKLFINLSSSYKKRIENKKIVKISVINLDDKESDFFWNFVADEKIGYGIETSNDKSLQARDLKISENGSSFVIEDLQFNLKLLGQFNVYNALATAAVGKSQGISMPVIKEVLEKISGIPGRMEEVKNNRGFRIFVDYAHEPASLEEAYKTIKGFNPKKVISVLGSQGGGRDKAKRPMLGRLAGQYADHVIITNEDPYDEDPVTIIEEVAEGATKTSSSPVEKVLDRKKAIQRSLEIAQPGDIVIISGKGCETVMAVSGGQMEPWSDIEEVNSLLSQSD